MGEEIFVDVSYRGIELGRRLRLEEFSAASAYLHCPGPMPVGSALSITTDEGHVLPVTVDAVIEQVAGAEKPPGMTVSYTELDGSAHAWWLARTEASASPVETEQEAAPQPSETLLGMEPPLNASDTLVTDTVTTDEVAAAAEEEAPALDEAPAADEAPPAEEKKTKSKRKSRAKGKSGSKSKAKGKSEDKDKAEAKAETEADGTPPAAEETKSKPKTKRKRRSRKKKS